MPILKAMKFYQQGSKDADFDANRIGGECCSVNPQFLFRVERPSLHLSPEYRGEGRRRHAPKTAYQISDPISLAALSSCGAAPDDELRFGRCKVLETRGLEKRQRLLADAAFAESATTLRTMAALAQSRIDHARRALFPISTTPAQGVSARTDLFVDRPRRLQCARFISGSRFNERLANHYGIPYLWQSLSPRPLACSSPTGRGAEGEGSPPGGLRHGSVLTLLLRHATAGDSRRDPRTSLARRRHRRQPCAVSEREHRFGHLADSRTLANTPNPSASCHA